MAFYIRVVKMPGGPFGTAHPLVNRKKMVLRFETEKEARRVLARIAHKAEAKYSFDVIDEREFAETWQGRRLIVPARLIDGEYVFK
jgi:predicted nuclease of restriction endonuclease-like RecB superfamily